MPDLFVDEAEQRRLVGLTAARMREQYETDHFRPGRTMRAVADWLDATREQDPDSDNFGHAYVVAVKFLWLDAPPDHPTTSLGDSHAH